MLSVIKFGVFLILTASAISLNEVIPHKLPGVYYSTILTDVYTHEIAGVQYKQEGDTFEITNQYNDASASIQLDYNNVLTAERGRGAVVLVLRGDQYLLGDQDNGSLSYNRNVRMNKSQVKVKDGDLVVLLVPVMLDAQCSVANWKLEFRLNSRADLAERVWDTFYKSCQYRVTGKAFIVQRL